MLFFLGYCCGLDAYGGWIDVGLFACTVVVVITSQEALLIVAQLIVS
jgi:hypothetical protein